MGINSHTPGEVLNLHKHNNCDMIRLKGLRLEDIFPTPATIRLLDFLLERPETPWSQGTLVSALHMDPATVRTALRRLQALGLVEVFTPPGVGPMKAISLRTDTPLGAALLVFHQSLTSGDENLRRC